ncbi:hypothetical protein H4R20_001694, partial [Coemansia guatemalensis]
MVRLLLGATLAAGLLSLGINRLLHLRDQRQYMVDTEDAHMAARAHIVVVGGGLAGLAAAAEALRATAARTGVTVTLVEKEARAGGNSAKASSGINGAPTRTQLAQGIRDSVEAFARDTLASGRGRSSTALVGKLVNDSAQAVAWLQD